MNPSRTRRRQGEGENWKVKGEKWKRKGVVKKNKNNRKYCWFLADVGKKLYLRLHLPQNCGSLLEATFALCSPFFSSLANSHKIGCHLVIHSPTLRFQASLSEWWIMDEIDESIIFMNICSLRLRMCIFCRTFAPNLLIKRWDANKIHLLEWRQQPNWCLFYSLN